MECSHGASTVPAGARLSAWFRSTVLPRVRGSTRSLSGDGLLCFHRELEGSVEKVKPAVAFKLCLFLRMIDRKHPAIQAASAEKLDKCASTRVDIDVLEYFCHDRTL